MKKLLTFGILFGLAIFNFAYATDIVPDDIVNIPTLTENLIIRDGDTIIFSGAVSLPAPGAIDLNDSAGVPHSIDARSVLSVLNSADIASADFDISDLEYYPSFGSLYLKCITKVATEKKCDNWQYTVNNSYPGVGMDQNILSGGENIYVYFGPQYRVLLSANEITITDTLTVIAEEYDYQDNTWKNRTGVTVGLTQPDPNNPWSPLESKTGAVDANGQIIFSEIPIGSYNVGIQQDFYFPTESLIVNPAPVFSGGGSYVAPPTFSVPDALAYLVAMQDSDGSFGGNALYTDWSGIALAAGNASDSIKNNILKYMSSRNVVSSILTDNERRAMALLALGQNPYSFYGVNYIDPIIDSFDGTQFGDISLVNDDIFALIVLASSGYTSGDDIISKNINFILSKQKPNGSWEESIDVTSAGIQVLSPFSSIGGVSSALNLASAYIANAQMNDGGWNNIYSTSWALQGASALGATWTKNGKSGNDYLAANQAVDGAVLPTNEASQNRIWATSYAIPAALGKTWNAIFHSVPKPAPPLVSISPVATNSVADEIFIASEKKKPVVVAPARVSLPVVTSKISLPISSTQQMPTNVLLATAEKSETRIPAAVIAVAAIFVGGIFFFRFAGSSH